MTQKYFTFAVALYVSNDISEFNRRKCTFEKQPEKNNKKNQAHLKYNCFYIGGKHHSFGHVNILNTHSV